MAAKLSFTLISRGEVDIDRLINIVNKEYRLDLLLSEIISIDDWMWTNEIRLKDTTEIYNMIDKGKIILIYFKTIAIKHVGLFIEKVAGTYIYDFWIDLKNYEYLDKDCVDSSNVGLLQTFCEIFAKIVEQKIVEFSILAIGVESSVDYDGNLQNTVNNAQNVSVWIVNLKYCNVKINNIDYEKQTLKRFVIYKKKPIRDVKPCKNFTR